MLIARNLHLFCCQALSHWSLPYPVFQLLLTLNWLFVTQLAGTIFGISRNLLRLGHIVNGNTKTSYGGQGQKHKRWSYFTQLFKGLCWKKMSLLVTLICSALAHLLMKTKEGKSPATWQPTVSGVDLWQYSVKVIVHYKKTLQCIKIKNRYYEAKPQFRS